jgi:hypothetical protein
VAIDFTRYQPPGVYTEPIPGPQLGVRSSVPTAVAIFGMTIGYRQNRESLKINPDVDEDTPATNKVLSHPGIITSSVQVLDPNSGQIYAENTDYTIFRVTAGTDATIQTQDDLYTINRVIDGGHIEPGDVIQIWYNYTDPEYFQVYNFYDYDDLEEAYGPAFNKQTGQIQSEVTLAARFAFMNGASTVIGCAVQPEDPESITMADYSDALDKFRDEDQIAILVPATGSQPIFQLVQAHVRAQSNNRYERVALLGFDGVQQRVPTSQRVIAAQSLNDNRLSLVSPDTFKYYAPELNREILLGGQFMAASLAGWAVAHNAAWPLTRKSMLGWRDIGTMQRDGEKNTESSNGLMVVEKTKRQLIQARHGVTTDASDLIAREWSITRQADVLVYRIRDYLDADELIGQPIYPTTIINVKASAESALQSLIRDNIIVAYQALKVRQIDDQPDVIEVRFQWKPAFPLNYIVVRYAITTTTGEIQQTSL